jgi:transposase
MEACSPSGWINDLAIRYGLKILVCSTNEDAWKAAVALALARKIAAL